MPSKRTFTGMTAKGIILIPIHVTLQQSLRLLGDCLILRMEHRLILPSLSRKSYRRLIWINPIPLCQHRKILHVKPQPCNMYCDMIECYSGRPKTKNCGICSSEFSVEKPVFSRGRIEFRFRVWVTLQVWRSVQNGIEVRPLYGHQFRAGMIKEAFEMPENLL